MNDWECNYISSLFDRVTPEEKRDLADFISNKKVHNYYLRHIIPKRSGGGRVIYEPNKTLKIIQKRINRSILKKVPVSDYACAYVPGRSILENAKPHVGKPILLKLDIHRFFDNIRFQPVVEIFEKMGHSTIFSRIVAGLIMVDDFLPQGAPTSPSISNIYLKDFDEKIGKYCKEHNISYTRYSDDLTFSMQQFDRELVRMVRAELRELGLELNKKKSKVISGPLQKRVTGVVVNKKPQASSAYRREIRQDMYYIAKFGLHKHLENKYNFFDEKSYVNHLLGRINFVLQLDRDNEEFKKYRELLSASSFDNLHSQLRDLLN